MKFQIEKLVCDIKAALAQPSPAMPELASCIQLMGLDGYSQVVALRCALARWAEDLPSKEDRQYAQEQLDGLPDF